MSDETDPMQPQPMAMTFEEWMNSLGGHQDEITRHQAWHAGAVSMFNALVQRGYMVKHIAILANQRVEDILK